MNDFRARRGVEATPPPPADPELAQTLRTSVLRWTAVALAFAAGAVALTWPLAVSLDGVALGTERVATVPLFNLWTLAWNVESLGRGFEGYWQAPIFHPTADAFAFSEPQPVLGMLAAALCSFGLSIVAAYGLLLIASLARNGLLTAVLLRRVGLGWSPSILGGALVLVLPFTHQQLGVLQLVPLGGVLLFALAVLSFAEAPKLTSGLGLGAGLALAYGLSAQVAVFGGLAATPAALWLWWPHRRERRAWIALAAGVALFFALASPLLVAQLRGTSNEGFVRLAETMRKHSAKPAQYFEAPWPQLLPAPGVETAERSSARAFWPGTLRVLLAFIAVALAWRSNRWRRPAVAGLLVLATSVLLSFGGHLGAFGLSLVDVLRALPGLGQIRNFFRFALFAQLAVALLAAGALHGVLEASRRRFGNGPGMQRAAAFVPAAVLALLAVFEMRPAPGPIQPLPPPDRELPWLTFIEEETAVDDVLAFLPFPQGRKTADYAGTSQWMYWQQRHWRPMVNGYSGFFPSRFKALKETMKDFPSAQSLAALKDTGVRYCIVPKFVIEASPPPDPDAAVTLALVFRDEENELAIFALRGDGASNDP
ncbi:MAG: hypothetical protein AAGN66_25250 [Acidobacteriota bacterium]